MESVTKDSTYHFININGSYLLHFSHYKTRSCASNLCSKILSRMTFSAWSRWNPENFEKPEGRNAEKSEP